MPDILADLNDAQRQAVTHVDGPLLLLAGAGSGKTRVITRRVAYLVQQGIAPWNVLAITFTNKAAEEMRLRVEALRTPRGATLCTFHALCARLLREFALDAGLAPNFSIYDRDDQLRLMKEAVKNLELRTENFPPSRVHAAVSNAKNELRLPEQLASDAGADYYLRQVAEVYGEYQRLLVANNALDFDDLLLRTAYMMRDRQDVRELLGQRYSYVLIDEYQDTNRAQYLLAHGIAMDHQNICATGDPDQSIYAWRGADIRNILEFEQDYPDAAVIRLEENYRSTQAILTAASSLISHNSMRKEKALWTRREGGSEVRVVYCDDEHAEADEIARRILTRGEGGGRFEDVAVFYRVNALSRVLEEAFRKAGVPYRIARGVEFYNRKEVKDVLAYLRVLANPDDDLSCNRIINTPKRGIGATTVGRLAAAAGAGNRSLLAACGSPEAAGLGTSAAKKVAAFAAMMNKLAGELDGPVKDVVETVITASGLQEALDEAGEDARQARANIDELISTAAEFQQTAPDARLADFLHQVSLVTDVDRMEGGTGAVTFMTLHAAKGLEFPCVFVVGCEEGMLPMTRMDQPGRPDPAAMEEERRLAFVGMTRAKDELLLTCARRRRIRGQYRPQAASPFLDEIGSESVVLEDCTTPDTDARLARRDRRGGFYADVDERAAIERAMDTVDALNAGSGRGEHDTEPPGMRPSAPPPAEYEDLVVNARIRHPKFGPGKVVGLRNPWPETRAEIIFDTVGHKTIWLKHTRLDVLEAWE